MRVKFTSGEAHQESEEYVWHLEGEFPNVTIHPSIKTPCWHGWIKDGEVGTN